MNLVTVREHARLAVGPVAAGSLDEASLSESAFDWLCAEAQRHRLGGAPLVEVGGRRWLRVDNYVGVLESPCGTRIEILPKHVDGETDVATARRVLVNMLRHGLRLPVRDVGPTGLQTFDAPVSEWIIQQFLLELDHLVRRGLRFDYVAVEEELRYLRGRLRVGAQLRQPPGRQHLFQVEHQVFSPDRPENRLIASALLKVAKATRDPGSWRLAHELEHQLVELERSRDIAADLRRWSSDRLMAHYSDIKPWCELILGDRNPLSALGEWRGRSLLFPMERVFERYVEARLRALLPRGAVLRSQVASQWLCRTEEREMFNLRPDFLIECAGQKYVVDAKWKLLDATDPANNYGLSQGDFYQLFAYGHRYLGGEGRMALVHPRTPSLGSALPRFQFDERLSLDVLPLDLETGVIALARLYGE
ncbi:McrC family protein [Lysobacter sp. A289]